MVVHTLSCTLESENVSIMGYGGLSFGSLDEMIKVDGLTWLDVSMEVPKGVARSSQEVAAFRCFLSSHSTRRAGTAQPERGSAHETEALCFYSRFCLGFKPFCPRVF